MFQALWGPSGLILLGVVISAIGALWSSQQQAHFEHELREKSEEIAALNKTTMNSIIGGESFCYISINAINNQTNDGLITVIHQGEFPMYDVNARIVDLQKFNQIKGQKNFATIRQADTDMRIGNIIPETASMLAPISLGQATEKKFNIFFSARNGLYNELLRLKKINNEWARAIKVTRNGETIYEFIDDSFPKVNGTIDWE